VGKSSIIRAVRSLFYDALRGSRFVKKGKSQSQVSISLEGGTVERQKGKGLNAYVVNGKQMEAIGRGVPPEVFKFLNIRPIRIDKDMEIEVNVVRQLEAPFLMALPGSAKAKVLNALTGHHVLDVATRETGANVR